MDRLFTVKSKEVRLSFEAGRKAVARVELESGLHTMHAAFKVLTTDPSTLRVRPPLAIVPPLATASFEVTMAAQIHPPAPLASHRLLVKSVMIPTGKASPIELDHLFSTMRKHVFTDATLRIVYTGPQILRSLALLDGSQVQEASEDVAAVLKDSRPHLDEQDGKGNTVLHSTAAAGNYPLVKALVEAGGSVNVKNRLGFTPFMEAVTAGCMDMVRVMLASGADALVADSRGCNAFHAAAKLNSAEILRLLLERGGSFKDASNDQGRTPLHSATSASNLEAVRLLLQGGANVEAKCLEGWTALHYAVCNGNLDIAGLLIEHGASTESRNRAGRSPYDMAVEQGHTHLFDAVHLREKLQRAARTDDMATAADCLRQGASPDGSDRYGWAPLHMAACKGHLRLLRLLLNHNAKVDCRDCEGHTPLHCAVEAGHKDVVEYLVRHGADVSARSRKGVMPLQLAVAMNYTGIANFLGKAALTRYGLEVLPSRGLDVGAVAILSVPSKRKGFRRSAMLADQPEAGSDMMRIMLSGSGNVYPSWSC